MEGEGYSVPNLQQKGKLYAMQAALPEFYTQPGPPEALTAAALHCP